MCPNEGVPKDPRGSAKLGWLNRLKNSARNCSSKGSRRRKSLVAEKSRLRKPGPKIALRPRSPNVPSAGWLKAAGFRYPLVGDQLERMGFTPATTFGRWRKLKVPLVSFELTMGIGRPD